MGLKLLIINTATFRYFISVLFIYARNVSISFYTTCACGADDLMWCKWQKTLNYIILWCKNFIVVQKFC